MGVIKFLLPKYGGGSQFYRRRHFCKFGTPLPKKMPAPLVGVEIRWFLGPIALKICGGPKKHYDQGPKWPLKMLVYFNT